MATTKRVWLRPELTNSENGPHQFEGDYGRERVVVVIDPSILGRLGPQKEQELLSLRRKVEDAATAKMHAGEAFPVHPYGQTDKRHFLIALTDQDVQLGE